MSETIPEDIIRASKAAYEAMPLCYDGWDEDTVVLCIARAIMAERERCAKIVSRMLKFADTTSKSDEAILAAIRTPSTGEEQ